MLGRLRGVMLCANWPGEHFAMDEKTLLGDVVRDVGVADPEVAGERGIRAGSGAGNIKPAAVRNRARVLATGWNAMQASD